MAPSRAIIGPTGRVSRSHPWSRSSPILLGAFTSAACIVRREIVANPTANHCIQSVQNYRMGWYRSRSRSWERRVAVKVRVRVGEEFSFLYVTFFSLFHRVAPVMTSSNSSTTLYCWAGVLLSPFAVLVTMRMRALNTLFLNTAVLIRSARLGRLPAART